MPKRGKRVYTRGAGRMLQLGYKAVQVFVTPEQHEALKAAAELEGRKVAQFVTFHALEAMRKANARIAKGSL